MNKSIGIGIAVVVVLAIAGLAVYYGSAGQGGTVQSSSSSSSLRSSSSTLPTLSSSSSSSSSSSQTSRSSSSSSSQTTSTSQASSSVAGAPGNGTLSLYLTDAPPNRTALKYLILNVTSLVLRYQGNVSAVSPHDQFVFNVPPRTGTNVNLTKLQGQSLLLGATKVPAGNVSSIILNITGAKAFFTDGTSAQLKVVADGKLMIPVQFQVQKNGATDLTLEIVPNDIHTSQGKADILTPVIHVMSVEKGQTTTTTRTTSTTFTSSSSTSTATTTTTTTSASSTTSSSATTTTTITTTTSQSTSSH